MAALLLSAHFLRQGNLGLTGVCLLAPLLLLVKKRWSLLVLQGLAYLGALIWLRTAIILIQQRLALGEPWFRIALILGAVALLTVVAGLLLNTAAVRAKYLP